MSAPSRPLPPQAREAVARFAARAGELTDRTRQACAAVRAATGRARSPDGAVTATVDIDGALTGLQLTAAAADRGVDALGRAVVSTAREAHRVALAAAADRVAELGGADSAAVTILRGR